MIRHRGRQLYGREDQLPPNVMSVSRAGERICLPPSHLQKRIAIQEVNPILNTTEIAVEVVIQYGGNFCRPRTRVVEVPISRSSPSVPDQGLWKFSPRNRLNLGDFARIQQGIRSTTEGSPNIESDDKFSRGARVTGAGCVHDGNQIKVTGSVWNFSLTRGFKYFRGPATHFLYRMEVKARHTDAGHTFLCIAEMECRDRSQNIST